MGFNVNNSDELTNKLELMCMNPELRMQMGMNARKCAEELFDRRKTYNTIYNCINTDGEIISIFCIYQNWMV